jgi:phosphoglycerate kinase
VELTADTTGPAARTEAAELRGPTGMFEREPFAGGTRSVARALADGEAFTVIGGDTGAAIRALGLAEDAFGYVSTGASLEFIQGKTLPGLAALEAS